MTGPIQAAPAGGGMTPAQAVTASGFFRLCRCCAPAAAEERERRRLVDLLELLEHPDTPIPPDLALRLSVRLLAETADHLGIVCEAVTEAAQ